MSISKINRISITAVSVVVLVGASAAWVDFAIRKQVYEHATETYNGAIKYEVVDHYQSFSGIRDEHNPFAHLNDLSSKQGAQILPAKKEGEKLTDADIREYTRLLDVANLSLAKTQVTNEGLKHLHNMSLLKILDLSHTRVSDDGMNTLADLPNLESLNLNNTKVTRRGLRNLKRAKKLAWLAIPETAVIDGGLEELTEFSNLKGLIVDGGRINDVNVAAISGIASLTALQLSEENLLSDTGIMYLAQLQNLEYLFIGRGNYGNEAMQAIARLPRLTSLVIQAGPALTVEGLPPLAKLEKLVQVHISGPNIREITSKDLPLALFDFSPTSPTVNEPEDQEEEEEEE